VSPANAPCNAKENVVPWPSLDPQETARPWLDNLTASGETEAGAFVSGGAMHASERLKDIPVVFLGNADAVVFR
jgi:hypothetical protein